MLARRALQAVRPPEPEVPKVLALYTSGILGFTDRNRVARGARASAQSLTQFRDGSMSVLQYCPESLPVEGLYLYAEDLVQLFARSSGAVVHVGRGNTFLGEANLFDTPEYGWLTPLLRRAFGLRGHAGFRIYFHESDDHTFVIAGIENFIGP